MYSVSFGRCFVLMASEIVHETRTVCWERVRLSPRFFPSMLPGSFRFVLPVFCFPNLPVSCRYLYIAFVLNPLFDGVSL